jgi:hypothetical protein
VSDERLEELRRLASKAAHLDVDLHPYDIGYWLCVAGENLPSDACDQMLCGYEAGNEPLEDED